jgi:hypothetical protein
MSASKNAFIDEDCERGNTAHSRRADPVHENSVEMESASIAETLKEEHAHGAYQAESDAATGEGDELLLQAYSRQFKLKLMLELETLHKRLRTLRRALFGAALLCEFENTWFHTGPPRRC